MDNNINETEQINFLILRKFPDADEIEIHLLAKLPIVTYI